MAKLLRSFITGSWAYGSPKLKQENCSYCGRPIAEGCSDVDLVVLVSMEDLETLLQESDDNSSSGSPECESLRFGKLNLICETDAVRFEQWRQGTKILRSLRNLRGRPVEREEAVELLDRLEDPLKNGFTDSLEFIKSLVRYRYYSRRPSVTKSEIKQLTFWEE